MGLIIERDYPDNKTREKLVAEIKGTLCKENLSIAQMYGILSHTMYELCNQPVTLDFSQKTD